MTPNASKLILLDAGHGGSAPGMVVGDIQEKDITLDIVRRLGHYLSNRGYLVHYTRFSDMTLTLGKRQREIEQLNPDACVSIHFNADPDGNPLTRGFEVFFRDAEDKRLAEKIAHFLGRTELPAHGGNVGIHQDQAYLHFHLAMLFSAAVPSCLVECLFMTNPQDMVFLNDNRDALAEVIGCGIQDYLCQGQETEEKPA